MVEPRCPHCNAHGVNKIAAKNLGNYSLIYCGQCGAIYGVVPKTQTKKAEEEMVTPARSAPAESVTKKANAHPERNIPPAPTNPDEAEALMRYYYFGQRGSNYMRIHLPPNEEANSDG